MTKKSYGFTRIIGIILLVAIALTSCMPLATIPVNQQFEQQAYQYNVTGRQGWKLNERISFGPYHTGKVDRDWTEITQWQFMGYQSSNSKGGFSFSVNDGSEISWNVDCRNRAELKQLNLDEWVSEDLTWITEADNRFSCSMYSESTTETWFMALAQNELGEPLGGMLTTKNGKNYRINGINQLQGAAFATGGVNGFNISSDSQSLAMIEIINDGRVWLHRELDMRESSLLASVAAALLLYQEPKI